MSTPNRFLSAGRRLDGFIPNSYSIFDRREDIKETLIWQPSGSINNLQNLPTPDEGMKDKADDFLQKANSNTCHIAVAPEWAYNIQWVNDHSGSLFNDDSPLFVLGCSPINESERQDVIESLEADYDVYEDPDVECDSDEFLTPTIIPIKSASRRESATDAILIQYKNSPMSDGVLPNEQANLAQGDSIWKIDPRDAPSVLVFTCSDVMDDDLREDVERYTRQNDTFVVHVQCNPDPFNETWVDFRNQSFDGSDDKVTYICANWGEISFSGKTNWFGYSGVYTKAKDRSTLDRYDTTYQNGGLVGTKPRYHCDHVWLMPNDVLSRVQFNRPNPGTTGAGAASFSLPRICDTWTWDSATGDYSIETPGVSECDDQVCQKWRSQLPGSPRARELVAAIGLGKIDFEELPSEELDPESDIRWAAIETLTDIDGVERLGHILATHPRRLDPSPGEEVELLVKAVEKAGEIDICINDQFELEQVPLNAEYESKNIDVCLVALSRPGKAQEQKGAKWLNEWVARRDDKRFKPIAIAIDETDGMVLKTLEGHEDVSRIDHDPERVSTTGGLVRVDR